MEYGDEGKHAQADELRRLILPVPWDLTEEAMKATADHWGELMERHEYGSALIEAQKLEASTRIRFGTNDRSYATVVALFSGTFSAQGRYDLAEQRDKRALAIMEENYKMDEFAIIEKSPINDDYLFVLGVSGHLDRVYADEHKYAEAEIHMKKKLANLMRKVGPKHPGVAACLNNLANVIASQGRYSEAESFYNQVFEIEEKSLGPNHPELITTLNNLAEVYQKQGRITEAEEARKRVSSIREKIKQ